MLWLFFISSCYHAFMLSWYLTGGKPAFMFYVHVPFLVVGLFTMHAAKAHEESGDGGLW